MNKISKRRVLIVDDETAVRELLCVALRLADFEVIEADSAQSALGQISIQIPDLILIDWMMPDITGLELCRRLRRDKNTASIPLVLLTARSEENAKIAGLDTADDYITKPFSTRELVARLRAILRRTIPPGIERPVEINCLRLDPVSQKVTVRGKLLTLSPVEYRLLQLFMTQPERVFSRTQLLDRIWGGDVFIADRTVDVHIRRLRKALGKKQEKLIETVRGTGYRFARQIFKSESNI